MTLITGTGDASGTGARVDDASPRDLRLHFQPLRAPIPQRFSRSEGGCIIEN
jgi:hypothetical protein